MYCVYMAQTDSQTNAYFAEVLVIKQVLGLQGRWVELISDLLKDKHAARGYHGNHV